MTTENGTSRLGPLTADEVATLGLAIGNNLEALSSELELLTCSAFELDQETRNAHGFAAALVYRWAMTAKRLGQMSFRSQ